MTRVSIRGIPKWNEKLVREKTISNHRGKVALVLVTGAQWNWCDFCNNSRQSKQLHGDTYLEERSGYLGIVGSRSQRDWERRRGGL